MCAELPFLPNCSRIFPVVLSPEPRRAKVIKPRRTVRSSSRQTVLGTRRGSVPLGFPSKTKSLLRLVAEGVQEAILYQNSQTMGELPSTSEVA